MNDFCPRRHWLEEELRARQRRNPAYSMRQFAQCLGVSIGTLSKIMTGKRKVTLQIAERVAERLAFSPVEKKNFVSGSLQKNLQLSKQLELSHEAFKVVSDWYHYAILSLARIPNCPADAKWIADKLQTSEANVTKALERLTHMGLVKVEKNKLFRIEKDLTTRSGFASQALRKYHAQNLQLAERSLERDAVESRHMTSMTFAIDPAKLADIVVGIKKLLAESSEVVEHHEPKQVYTMAVQLFPVSKKINVTKIAEA